MYSNGGLFVRRRPPPPRQHQRLAWGVITAAVALGLLLYVRHVVLRLFGGAAPAPAAAGALRGPLAAADADDGGLGEDPHLSDAYLDRLPPHGEPSTQELADYEQELLRQAEEAGLEAMEQAHGHTVGGGAPGGGEQPPPELDAEPAAAPRAATALVAAPRAAGAGAAAAAAPAQPSPPSLRHKALIFTMDGMADYVRHSKAGGPAGEIIVRESLEWGLRQLGVEPVVAGSDAAFAELSGAPEQYQLYFLDPWTFVDPGWRPRPFLVGREARSFMLSFFGAREAGHGWALPPAHILTPFPVVGTANSFLGYAMPRRWLPAGADDTALAAAVAEAWGGVQPARLPAGGKKRQGVLWGKKAEYFAGREGLLAKVAALAPLHSTAAGLGGTPGVVVHGHLSVPEWHALLAESRFLLGLGDPLIGPSALDAVGAGAVFINPHYAQPKLDFFASQHPYLEGVAGSKYVCPVSLDDEAAVLACVQAALEGPDLEPFVPPDMARGAYLQRLKALVQPLLDK